MMPFLQGSLDLIKGIIRRTKSLAIQPVRDRADRSDVDESQRQKSAGCGIRDGQERSGYVLGRRKRKAQNDELETSRKRGKTAEHGTTVQEHGLDVVGGDEGNNEKPIPSPTNKEDDRNLMPPPMKPLLRRTSTHSTRRTSRDSFDNYSEARTQRSRLTDFDDEYDMEAARRKAAATRLPLNSGTWEQAERDLFLHLSYRGFEPLLPKNWMVDFGTLPISLFATQPDQIPLIRPDRSGEFRAIKALRELIDTGKVLRDRTLSTNAQLRSEPVIERAANRYIKWGLNDLGISSKRCIPVHAMVAMKQGQNTQDTIRELTAKMHKLSARHREACDVLASIEQEQDYPPESQHKLPVIYGLMICSSLLAVFTLSCHTPPPRFIRRAQAHRANDTNDPNETVQEHDDEDDDESSGVRFIASFDFSDPASDVWNAFVIAIVAMMIRQSLLEVYDVPATDVEQAVDESVIGSSLIDGDLEGGRDGYIAGYAASRFQNITGIQANSKREVDDDPDL